MTAERIESQLISVEDYLKWEAHQPAKHEYVGGMVYAMAGGTTAHSAIASNALVSLGGQLHGKRCRPHNSDLKIRIHSPTPTRFYYPGVTVACTHGPSRAVFHDQPVVIVEVTSGSTQRTDEWEKRDAYQTIPTFRVDVLLDREKPEAMVWRRSEQGFGGEVHSGLEAIVALPEIEARLPLLEACEAVVFSS